VTNVAHVGEK